MSQYGRYPAAGGGSGGVTTYPTFASLPVIAGDGTLALVLDTDTLYEFNLGTASWVRIAAPDAAYLPENQTFTGNNTFNNSIKALGGVDVNAAGTLAIGTGNATTINIGNSSATVNIAGTVLYENVNQLQVKDPLITVNKGGGAGSASNSGIEIEENNVITGYAETSADRNSWTLKAPNTAGIATITPGASGITLNQSSHDPVTLGTANGLSLSTQLLSLDLSSSSTTGALSSTDWTTFNNKQSTVSFSAVGAAPNANGAVISSGVITLEPADATNPGLLTAGAQTIGGAKTLNADLTLSGNLILTPTVNNSLTGANARVPSHTTANIVFTNASLTSIGSANNGGVVGGHTLYITNATGNSIVIVNNYGSAAAGEAIITGINADVTVPNKGTFALQYNATSSCWSYIGAGLTVVSSGSVTGVLPVANGGTNSSTTLNNNRIMVSSGSAIVENSALVASRAMATDTNGLPSFSATTVVELGYVSGATSNIQTQINSKVGGASNLTAAGTVPYVSSTSGILTADLFSLGFTASGLYIGSSFTGKDITVNNSTTDVASFISSMAYGASGGATLRLGAKYSGNTPVTSGARLGALVFSGWTTSAPAYGDGASIESVATQNWSATAEGSKLRFLTKPNSSTTSTLALTIDQDQSATFAGALNVTGTTTLATSLSGPLKASSGVVSASSINLASEVTGTLPIANGGTNNGSLAVTAGGVVYTDGTKLVNVGAGTSGYVLTSNGASAPTWSPPGGAVAQTFLTANSTSFTNSGTSSGNYAAMTGASVTLTSGLWNVQAFYLYFTGGAGSGVGLYGTSGLYGANGANSASQPASIASLGTVTSVNGITNFDGTLSQSGDVLSNVSGSGNEFSGPMAYCQIAVNGNTTIYAVPRIIYSSASNSFTRVSIIATKIG